MLRVLVITPQFPPNISGGLGRQVGDMVRHLADKVEFGVIAPSPAPSASGMQMFPFQEYGDMLPEAGIPPLLRMNLAIQSAAFNALGSNSWDVIHAHDWAIAPAATQIANASGTPMIATIHADNAGELGGSAEDRIRRLEWEQLLVYISKVVSGVSAPLTEALSARYPEADVRAIPNGIEMRESLVDRADANPGEILFVGRLVPYKGVQDLLNAMPLILRSMPEARLRIVGDGFYGNELKQLRRNLGLEDVVEFAGWLEGEDLQTAYMQADIMVTPSHEEAFGLVVAEAMAAGVPVVASDCPAFQELVDDGVTGRLFQTGNVDHLARILIDELKQDEENRHQTIDAARKMIEQQYSWSVIGQQYLDLYQESRQANP